MTKTALKTEYKRKKPPRTVDFAGHKPQADTARRSAAPLPLKAPPVSYREVFGIFKPQLRTTGEDMLIIRAFMHRQGLPEVPEHFSIPQFASAMQWKMRPRYAWQHFVWFEVAAARAFISAWASALLPQMLEA